MWKICVPAIGVRSCVFYNIKENLFALTQIRTYNMNSDKNEGTKTRLLSTFLPSFYSLPSFLLFTPSLPSFYSLHSFLPFIHSLPSFLSFTPFLPSFYSLPSFLLSFLPFFLPFIHSSAFFLGCICFNHSFPLSVCLPRFFSLLIFIYYSSLFFPSFT